jgi:hypothetical protein
MHRLMTSRPTLRIEGSFDDRNNQHSFLCFDFLSNCVAFGFDFFHLRKGMRAPPSLLAQSSNAVNRMMWSSVFPLSVSPTATIQSASVNDVDARFDVVGVVGAQQRVDAVGQRRRRRRRCSVADVNAIIK